MDIYNPTTVICVILAMDQSCFSYKACSNCETAIPEIPSSDFVCKSNRCNGRSYPYKRLFRLLFSIAAESKVFNVVCFDKAAQVIFGCSALQFFDFSFQHPFAAENASNALVGEMFRITLVKPKRVKADHLRMTKVVPLRSGFQPVIKTLEELYKVIYGDKAA
ncbi:uncharacterized protein LOC111285162 [Durio zibethinus]|uniref:Uncharacterized protein LOC111285162 n=1 Tax=Durio zibethinus TaxID=66656 RepID=A0A6P5XPU1_DURZI|nr:uncharacterized protein LOC111285162 [Durio zibethinus]